MTTAVQHRRGTTAEHAAFTGLEGELTIDTTKDTAVIHDGTLAGGYPLAKENLANVTTSGLSSIDGASTASDDKFFIYDQSATSLKTITRAELNNAIEQDALANVAITGGTINGTTIGGTTAAAVSATTLTTSSTVTHNGGTANSVCFLNSSKVLTTGSALTFDGTKFGIGTSSPGAMLDLAANNTAGTALNVLRFTDTDGSATAPQEIGKIEFYSSDASTPGAGVKASIVGIAEVGNPGGALTFNTDLLTGAPIERMRIDRFGNVGIGTSSPQGKLSVSNGTIFVGSESNTTQTNNLLNGYGYRIGTTLYGNVSVRSTYSQVTNAASLEFYVGSSGTTTAEAMRLDSAGNLGLGVTPSAWGGSIKAIQMGFAGSTAISGRTDAFQSNFTQNAYDTGSNSWVYLQSTNAMRYSMVGGQHQWYTAPSGTAGNAISFTQAATLTAGGNWLVGTTSDISGNGAYGTFGNSSAAGANRWAAFFGANSGSSNPAPGFGLTIGWNKSSGGGETNIVYGTAAGSTPGLAFSSSDGTTLTERARIDSSGNLGIGTSSPAVKLHVSGSFGSQFRLQETGGTYFDIASGGRFDLKNAAGTTIVSIAQSGSPVGTQLNLDSSGNLGLGVTPSAWGSAWKAMQISTFASFGGNNDDKLTAIGNNYYNDGSAKYIGTGQAALYSQYQGAHRWATAPSGTAGNAISFTQAMTLDASGNLLIGRTSPSISGVKVDAEGLFGSIKSGNWSWSFGASASINAFVINDTTSGSSVERARIDSSGNLLVGTTSVTNSPNQGVQLVNGSSIGGVFVGHANGTATGNYFATFSYDAGIIGSITQNGVSQVLYNISSDQRLKDNIQDADSASGLIDSLQVRQFDWKADGSHQRYGFVAQELVTVAPEAVHQPADPEAMMAVDYSKLVPMLVKEIQSLRQRLAAAGI